MSCKWPTYGNIAPSAPALPSRFKSLLNSSRHSSTHPQISAELIRHPRWDFLRQLTVQGVVCGVPPPLSTSCLQLLCQGFPSMQCENRTDNVATDWWGLHKQIVYNHNHWLALDTNHWLSEAEILQNLVWKVVAATGKISSKSEMVKWGCFLKLVRLTWNDPTTSAHTLNSHGLERKSWNTRARVNLYL